MLLNRISNNSVTAMLCTCGFLATEVYYYAHELQKDGHYAKAKNMRVLFTELRDTYKQTINN